MSVINQKDKEEAIDVEYHVVGEFLAIDKTRAYKAAAPYLRLAITLTAALLTSWLLWHWMIVGLRQDVTLLIALSAGAAAGRLAYWLWDVVLVGLIGIVLIYALFLLLLAQA